MVLERQSENSINKNNIYTSIRQRIRLPVISFVYVLNNLLSIPINPLNNEAFILN